MNIKILYQWQDYILTYAAGVLWIAAATVCLADSNAITTVFHAINALMSSVPSIRLPESVLVFGCIVITIVLPYAVGLALRAPSLEIVAQAVRVHAIFFERIISPDERKLRKQADEIIIKIFGPMQRVPNAAKFAYIEQFDPKTGQRLREYTHEAFFSYIGLLPTSIFLAGLLIRVGTLSSLAAIFIGSLIFILGIWWTNVSLFNWQRDINVNVVLASVYTSRSVQPDPSTVQS